MSSYSITSAMSLWLLCFGCLIVISYGGNRFTQCLYEIDVCVDSPSQVAGGVFLNDKSIFCECEGTTLSCVQWYQVLGCPQTDLDSINAFTNTNSPCCVTPAPAPSCCIGTTSKCDTDSKTVCDRASTCEWKEDEVLPVCIDCTPFSMYYIET